MRNRPFTRSALDSPRFHSGSARSSSARGPRDRSTYLEDEDVGEYLISSNDQRPPTTDKSSSSSDNGFSISPIFNLVVNTLTSPRVATLSLIVISVSAIVLFTIMLRQSAYMLFLRVAGAPPGVYSYDGKLYIGYNTRFNIKGFSWFGLEESRHVLGGLDKTSVHNVLTFAKRHKFNAIRLPLSLQNIQSNPVVTGDLKVFSNPDMNALRYFDFVRVFIRSAADFHILVLLDVHRLNSDDVQAPGLWYTKDFTEQNLFEGWTTLCSEFGEEWNVFGADIINEPWNVTWGADDPDSVGPTNWKPVVERLTDHIHKQCPSWLVFIEGLGNRAGNVTSNTFWSENLRIFEGSPPQVRYKSKTVLSPHVYGPSVFMQDYFQKDNFIDGMPPIWEDHFGTASNTTGLATVIGEWGGKFFGKDRVWQKSFFNYIMEKEFSFFYWCLNPESYDTAGLVEDDWKTPVNDKLDLLSAAPSTDVETYKAHFQYFRSWRR